MLFRRSTYYSFILIATLALASGGYGNDTLDRYKKRGEDRAKHEPRLELSQKELNSITPNSVKGKTFDGEQALLQLESNSYQSVEKAPNDIDPSLTAVMENTEYALQNQPKPKSHEEIIEETIEKCLFEREIVPVALTHTLAVKVVKKPDVIKTIRVCQGHMEKKKSRNPNHDKDKQKAKLEADPTIKSYTVYIEENGLGHRDEVVSRYSHVDNAAGCDHFKEIQKVESSDQWEEVDNWKMDQQALLDSLDCTLISTENGPAEKRMIDEHEVHRPFWSKTHHMQCIRNRQIKCKFLSEKTCIEMYKKCINNFGSECLVWEKTFKCRTRTYRGAENDPKAPYGSDSNLWNTDYQPCKAFPDVATKLAVFDEMKKELQNAMASDVRQVSLFKGNKQKCSKSVLEDVMYDCCQGMDGFATQVKLSKCTSDEIALAEARKNGLVHLVGSKKEDFIGLWNSRTEYVFCVFPTKLSRVFQEEARKQLSIGWGSASHPDCRGLSQEEIKKLDFTKMNLLEAFELPPQVDQTGRIKMIEERLKQRLESM